jgi:hypothetical protein
MEESLLQPGTEVVIAFASLETIESGGAVCEVGPDWIAVVTDDRYAVLKPGVSVSIRQKESSEPVGWGEVSDSSVEGEGMKIRIGNIRWEDASIRRAMRFPVEVRIGADILDEAGDHLRRTIGYSMNISLTGLRARFRTPLVEGSTVHLTVHFGSSEPLRALAKVTRGVRGTETEAGGSYEVGIEFARIISGFGDFAKAFSAENDEEEAAPESDPPVADSEESAA